MIDLRCDCHVHTGYAAGRDSISVLVAAAERAGLVELTVADRVGPDTGWLPAYRAALGRAQQRTEVRLRRGVEVEPVGVDGWLALPADLGGLDVVSLGLGRLPTPGGLLAPAAVRALLQAGVWRAGEVVERVLSVLALATERVARYAPTRLARPLEFLARAGVGEAD